MSDKPIKTTNAPLYAGVYATLVPIARAHGYALAIHGSMARDLDLVAVPWVEKPSVPERMIAAFAAEVYFNSILGPAPALHGRVIWTLTFPGDCFVDLSVMPANAPTRAEHSALRQRFNEVTDRLMQARRAIVALRGYRAKGPMMS